MHPQLNRAGQIDYSVNINLLILVFISDMYVAELMSCLKESIQFNTNHLPIDSQLYPAGQIEYTVCCVYLSIHNYTLQVK